MPYNKINSITFFVLLYFATLEIFLFGNVIYTHTHTHTHTHTQTFLTRIDLKTIILSTEKFVKGYIQKIIFTTFKILGST